METSLFCTGEFFWKALSVWDISISEQWCQRLLWRSRNLVSLLLVVVLYFLLQFNLSGFKELIVFHLFFLGFNRRKTSCPGIALSSPLS